MGRENLQEKPIFSEQKYHGFPAHIPLKPTIHIRDYEAVTCQFQSTNMWRFAKKILGFEDPTWGWNEKLMVDIGDIIKHELKLKSIVSFE